MLARVPLDRSHCRQRNPIKTCTGLLGEHACGGWDLFSSTTIDIDQEKKVDLGVLRGVECHGRVPEISFPRDCGVCVKEVSGSRSPLEIDASGTQENESPPSI